MSCSRKKLTTATGRISLRNLLEHVHAFPHATAGVAVPHRPSRCVWECMDELTTARGRIRMSGVIRSTHRKSAGKALPVREQSIELIISTFAKHSKLTPLKRCTACQQYTHTATRSHRMRIWPGPSWWNWRVNLKTRESRSVARAECCRRCTRGMRGHASTKGSCWGAGVLLQGHSLWGRDIKCSCRSLVEMHPHVYSGIC